MDLTFTGKRSTPWAATHGLDGLLEQWRGDRRVWGNIALDELLEGAGAKSVPVPETLEPRLRQALAARGIKSLYTHQALAFEQAMAGRDLVVATPTASRKSLCYVLPGSGRAAGRG